MEITNIEKLKNLSTGVVVQLPSFGDGEPFVCKVKRASLLGLASSGIIPNTLLVAAHQVFFGSSDKDKKATLKETSEIYKIVAKACLVEPSYEELQSIGLELTDDQIIGLFNYSQEGIKALERFRTESGNPKSN